MVLRGNGGNGRSYKDLEAGIAELLVLANQNDCAGIKVKLQEIIPEYLPYMETGMERDKKMVEAERIQECADMSELQVKRDKNKRILDIDTGNIEGVVAEGHS